MKLFWKIKLTTDERDKLKIKYNVFIGKTLRVKNTYSKKIKLWDPLSKKYTKQKVEMFKLDTSMDKKIIYVYII
jgi:hypothetical protein